MSKKSAQWITIPEASLHTPVSEAGTSKSSKAESPDKVKNKLFWGIGFVVLLVAAFAVMAPAQFSSLLKGSLFDTAGLPAEQTGGVISPLNLLPSEVQKEEEVAPPEETATIPAEAPAAPESEPVVKPQEQPVSVSIEPISTPEEVAIEPIVAGPADCKADTACLLPHLADCSLAKGTFTYSVMGQVIEADLEITGAEGESCLTKAVITKVPQADLVGKEAVCKLPKGAYTQESLQAKFSDPAALAEVCSGSAVDSLKSYLGLLAVGNNQAQLVQQLMQQVQQLQKQKDQGTEMMQDLVNLVQTQNGAAVRPSAPEQTGTISAPSTALQPGFRENPYRVTVSPEQMLRQNAASGASQFVSSSLGNSRPSTASQQVSQFRPVTGSSTPQTGPETTALALFVAFVALVFWKFVRTFSRA